MRAAGHSTVDRTRPGTRRCGRRWPTACRLSRRSLTQPRPFLRLAGPWGGVSDVILVPHPKQQPNGTPGKKPLAPSVKSGAGSLYMSFDAEPGRFKLTNASQSCRTRETTSSFGRSNFDPSTASDSRPIFLFLFPTWPLHDSIAVMSIGRHRRSWTPLMRASCRTRGMTNSFGRSNFDP
jgi:hypothetical protein